MVKCTLCNEEFETDEVLQKHMRICIFCIDQKSLRKMTLTDKEKIIEILSW